MERGLWNKTQIWVESKENENYFVNINKRGLWENKEDAMKYVTKDVKIVSVDSSKTMKCVIQPE